MKLSPEERERLAQQLLDSSVAANDEMDAEELGAVEETLNESARQFAPVKVATFPRDCRTPRTVVIYGFLLSTGSC